jgi:hypothetical protein
LSLLNLNIPSHWNNFIKWVNSKKKEIEETGMKTPLLGVDVTDLTREKQGREIPQWIIQYLTFKCASQFNKDGTLSGCEGNSVSDDN